MSEVLASKSTTNRRMPSGSRADADILGGSRRHGLLLDIDVLEG